MFLSNLFESNKKNYFFLQLQYKQVFLYYLFLLSRLPLFIVQEVYPHLAKSLKSTMILFQVIINTILLP